MKFIFQKILLLPKANQIKSNAKSELYFSINAIGGTIQKKRLCQIGIARKKRFKDDLTKEPFYVHYKKCDWDNRF